MEPKEADTTKLSASLGLELEVFYKELQSRLKSQYDLEDWKQRRAKMALKRRGLKSLTPSDVIAEVETENDDLNEDDNTEILAEEIKENPDLSADLKDSNEDKENTEIQKVKTEEEIKEVINEDLDSNIDKEKTKCTDSAINKEVSEFQDTVGILDKNSVSISEVEKVRN